MLIPSQCTTTIFWPSDICLVTMAARRPRSWPWPWSNRTCTTPSSVATWERSGGSGIFVNALYWDPWGWSLDVSWLFKLDWKIHQGIFVLNSLIVVLNFNSSKLISSFALHLFLLIAKTLLVTKHHYLGHELSHKFLIILTVSMAPFERLKNSIRSRQQKKFCFHL